MSSRDNPEIVIQELGSQTTLAIERAARELGYRAVVMDPGKAGKWIQQFPPKVVILSGGKHSVDEDGAPQPSDGVLNLKQADGTPVHVLGICYGQQWIAHTLGGTVASHTDQREYGKAIIQANDLDHPLFRGTALRQQVWMNHGDSVVRVPHGFTSRAVTDAGTIAAMTREHVWCVQFHPEVTQTEFGKTMLKNLFEAAGCIPNWKPQSLIDDIQQWVLDQVGTHGIAMSGMSGGVDSTTLGAILSPVLGKRLVSITVDAGQFRENEHEEVRLHARHAGLQNFKVVDVQDEMEQRLADVIDAEQKRKRFQPGYAGPFIKTGLEYGAKFMLQGTLAPDLIESGKTGGDLIKTHHNVGLDLGTLRALDPIGHLFKYEIRALAESVGLPRSVTHRQPFPGPGLFIRTVGFPCTRKNVSVTRWADARVVEVAKSHSMYDDTSQLVTGYVNARITGVKGDKRAYAGIVVVRAVRTMDFLTAEGVHLSEDVQNDIENAVLKHPEIVRVWWDTTNKPPGTVEFE